MKDASRITISARSAAARAVAQLVRSYPDLPPTDPDSAGLDERDARLAIAIYQATVQRWLTLEFLLNRHLRKKVEMSEPMLQAVLLTAAAQLLFMGKMPPHAVVDESVKLSRKLVRPAVGDAVNAVLREVAQMVEARGDEPYRLFPTLLPLESGCVKLRQAWLPPVKTLDRHLSIATSHPLPLVQNFLKQFGPVRTQEILLHSLRQPPTILFLPGGANATDAMVSPHSQNGFFIWRESHSQLADFLAATGGWVQDPASHAPVAATHDLKPKLIVDYCAGRGTKTRQLAHEHPEATIIAADTDAVRFAALRAAFDGHPRVRVVEQGELKAFAGKADLLLLDVPCSNTGVMARRLEARYRYDPDILASLLKLQREIITEARSLLNPAGTMLYSTCSLDESENRGQAEFAAGITGMKITREHLTLPTGSDATYHDGGYFAFLQP